MVQSDNSQLRRRVVLVGQQELGVTSYPVGARWACRVDNVDPGTIIGRASGATREEAVELALASAVVTLGMREAKDSMRRSVEELRKGRGRK